MDLKSDGIKEKLGINIAVTPKMKQAIRRWQKAYINESDWLNKDVKTLNIAASVASEIARLVTIENTIEISGSERADFIGEQLNGFKSNKKNIIEIACSVGGVVFKPYVSNDNILLDFTYQDEMLPFRFDDNGKITGIIFPSYKFQGNRKYTRLEIHDYKNEKSYRIQNKCFMSKDVSIDTNEIRNLGIEVPLSSIEEWTDIEPDVNISGVDGPFFSFFKIPIANNIERKSPLGVSVYARAIEDIKKADIQASRMDWEFENKETAIEVDTSMIEEDIYGTKMLPKGKERLFRTYDGYTISDTGAKLFKHFSPEIRDESFSRGLDKILKRIEYNCGLAYGTLSDPQNVDKTAEEIKSSKQRSYQLVKDIQESLEIAISNLVHVMDNMCTAHGLVPDGAIQEIYSWDDSIIVDAEKEQENDRKDVAMGVMSLLEYRMKWKGEDEKTALKNLPQQADVMP
ncbi:MAG: phage portal protein [Clostridium sp.]|jgi:A118 family predicted phage portal protein|nr:phage portal protein [[Clostridium] innocuum]QSI25288.1 hypothetical protein GKZ87_07225 [Erysipelotrichaceae bacterium 66202529]DAQ27838.1 MAG TPA: portal protein [Caudoviricetes sp.]